MLTLTALVAFTSTTFAIPLSALNPRQPAPSTYSWSVINWSAGCARAGCYYDFNITGPCTSNIPSFSAYCSGNDVGYYVACSINDDGPDTRGVAASLLPREQNTEGGARISVSFRYSEVDVP